MMNKWTNSGKYVSIVDVAVRRTAAFRAAAERNIEHEMFYSTGKESLCNGGREYHRANRKRAFDFFWSRNWGYGGTGKKISGKNRQAADL